MARDALRKAPERAKIVFRSHERLRFDGIILQGI